VFVPLSFLFPAGLFVIYAISWNNTVADPGISEGEGVQ
jgi:hypothetical protein